MKHKFQLLNGSKCIVNEPMMKHVWAGMAKFNFWNAIESMKQHRDGEQYEFPEFMPDIMAYIIREIITIDDEKPSIEQIGNLSIDDWAEINAFINVFMEKFNQLNQTDHNGK